MNRRVLFFHNFKRTESNAMRKKKTFAAALALLIGLPLMCEAADGLYPAPPPPGSAFMRFFSDDARAPAASVRGRAVHAGAAGEVGPYVVVQPGEAAIRFGGAAATQKLEPGHKYAALLAHGKLTVREEPDFSSRLKVQIVLLNLSKLGDVSLRTADGKTPVIAVVAPAAVGAREVNAVKAGFTVFAGEKKIGDLPPRALERGAGYAVEVYDGPDGTPRVACDKAGTS